MKSRWLFLLLLLAFIAGTAKWVLHLPVRAETLLRTLPADCIAVSRHRNLPATLEVLSEHPLGDMLTDSEDALHFPPLIHQLFDDITLGLRPEAHDGGYSIVMLAPQGAQAIWLRLLLELKQVPGVALTGSLGGYPVWRWVDPSLPQGRQFHFTINGGLLIATLSDHLSSFYDVLESMTGRSVSMLNDADQIHERLFQETQQHHGVVLADDSSDPTYWHTTSVDNDMFSIDIELPYPVPDSAATRMISLTELLQDDPLIFSALPTAYITRTLKYYRLPAWSSWLQSVRADVLAAALLTDPFSGRIYQMKMPSLVMALHMNADQSVSQALLNMIDDLNRRYQWGLIARPRTSAAGNVYFSIEGTGNNYYSKLSDEDQFAALSLGRWLVLCSSTRVLERLLQRFEQIPYNDQPDWLPVQPSSGSVFIDMERAYKPLSKALAAYSFRLILMSGEEAERERERIQRWKEKLKAFQAIESVTVHTVPEKNGTLITVNIQSAQSQKQKAIQ